MTDKTETTALVIAEELNEWARDYALTDLAKALAHCGAALLKNQQARIAELEALQAAPPAPAAVAVPAIMTHEEAVAAIAINSALHRIREGNAAGAIEPLEQARAALAATPAQAVAVPADALESVRVLLRVAKNQSSKASMAHAIGVVQAEVEKAAARITAAPAQEHTTQLAGQGQTYSIDADPQGIRARVADAITGALGLGAQGSGNPPPDHWLTPFWNQARFGQIQYNALRDSAEAMLNAPGALTQAARDVLAERARQVDAEGFNHARDDKYVGLQLAGAAASYLILAAGGREDDARAFWPWQQEWLKPSEQRRYLEKAGALVLAELERLDRASARAAQGGA